MTACSPATRGREVGKARGPRRMYYHENRIYTPTSLSPQIAVEIMLHTDSRDASRFFAVASGSLSARSSILCVWRGHTKFIVIY